KGRFLVVSRLLDLDVITFVNIYAPNKDVPGFFTELVPILNKFGNTNLITGGDFNLVVNPELDRSKGKLSLPSKIQLVLFELMNDFDLRDIWRVLHPMVKDYTFTFASHLTSSRIDLLISSSLVPVITTTYIHPMVISDHSPVSIASLNPSKPPSTPRWKLNTFLPKDSMTVATIKESLKDFIKINQPSSLSVAGLWEALKCFIRRTLISISSANKKRIHKEQELHSCLDENCWKDLLSLCAEYDTLMLEKAEFAILKSRTKYLEQGERSGKLLALHLKKQEQSRSIPVIHHYPSATHTSNPKLINDTFASFYENLYKDVSSTKEDLDAFFSPLPIPQLSTDQNLLLSAPITIDEILFVITRMKGNKAPGPD
uniref:Endonuclease/exonuclease/phosphatase domain-containing protein n=1 Tax=Latimeria chalumnae TaxID=7897 RepID=H3B956_LATCH